MAAVEYTPQRRTWVRDVLVGITASLGSNLMWELAQIVVHRLGGAERRGGPPGARPHPGATG